MGFSHLLNVARMILKALRDLFVGNDDDDNNNNNNNGGDGNNNNGGDDDHDGYYGGGGGNDDDDDDDLPGDLVDDDDDDDDEEDDQVRVRYRAALNAYNRARRGNDAIPPAVRLEFNAANQAYQAISDVREARNARRRERIRSTGRVRRGVWLLVETWVWNQRRGCWPR